MPRRSSKGAPHSHAVRPPARASLIAAGLLTIACAAPRAQNRDNSPSSTSSAVEKSVTADTTRVDSQARASASDRHRPKRVAAAFRARTEPAAAGGAAAPAHPAVRDGRRGKRQQRGGATARSSAPPAAADDDPQASKRSANSAEERKRRAQLSAYLLPLAEKAAAKSDTRPLAVSLYRGLVAARGAGDPIALKLAETFRLAEDYASAATVYRAFAEATDNKAAAARAREQARIVAEQTTQFSRAFREEPALKEARKAFNEGRKAAKRKRWDDALVYFQMAAGLAPDMPGPMRELGTVYRKLGETSRARDYFHAYLRQRPVGKIATEVRRALHKDKDPTLGSLTVEGTQKLPCDEVWVNGQRVTQKLPIKGLTLPAGSYTWLCFSPKYAFARYKQVDVPAGGEARLEFHWALVENALKSPYGRIRVEYVDSPELMFDLGVTPLVVGVPVPSDGRALRFKLISDDRSKIEDRTIKLSPGERTVIEW